MNLEASLSLLGEQEPRHIARQFSRGGVRAPQILGAIREHGLLRVNGWVWGLGRLGLGPCVPPDTRRENRREQQRDGSSVIRMDPVRHDTDGRGRLAGLGFRV